MENKVVNESNIRKPDPASLLKKNAMLIVLVLVYIFFTIMTKGRMFKPNSFNSLIIRSTRRARCPHAKKTQRIRPAR